MTPSKTLTVALEDRSYGIHIGAGLIEQAGHLLAPVLQKPGAFIVTDDNVAPRYLEPLQKSLGASGIKCDHLILPAGEATKSFANLQVVVEAMLAAKVERSTTAIALGGGVIGDLTGFAASVTLRGIDFVQVPTTLLAQVDSSVGGKTGINTAQGKNLAGSFYQPKAVLVDTDTLKTLPDRERLAGYAEVCKYGLLGDVDFWDWLEQNGARVLSGDNDAITNVIEISCEAKARVVTEDERESGVRALLNLGHTFAHAFEAELGYSGALLHGEAVAIGIVMAFDLSVRLGLCPALDADRVRAHFNAVGLMTKPPVEAQRIAPDVFLGHMMQDKKVADGKITFVLVRGIGQAFLTQDVTQSDVTAIFEAALTV
ncbi:MAG: 3-dehydroquinate synthase [Rhodospirillaceae bacterium]|nr:3-dehydroquinate synthase [Rhodospirillaceae bacterium]MBT5566752.1 3-dehydroquinate synthase [Rhodospirillaceae bacterium]